MVLTPYNKGKIQIEKDYFIREMKIIAYNGREYDISLLRGDFVIFEDLFSPIMTATLEMIDSADLPQLLPFIGQERVRVVFTRQDEKTDNGFLDDVRIDFRVYKVTDRREFNTKAQQYFLHLVSDEVCKNFCTKVYKGWKAKKYSEIVQEIYNDNVKVKKNIIVEETDIEHNLCLGDKNPFDIINMLASKSNSTESTKGIQHGAPFLFYEDRDNFHFRSLSSLILQDPFDSYIRKLVHTEVGAEKQIEKNIRRIEHYHWNSTFDVLKLSGMGLYGQQLVTADPIRRKIKEYDFKITEEWENLVNLDKNQFFTETLDLLDMPQAHRKVMITDFQQNEQSHLADKDNNIRPQELETYVQKRTAKLAQMMHTRLGITVPGDPRLKIGQVIEVKLPQSAGDIEKSKVSETRNEKFDKYYYGRYLIVSIRHKLIFNEYTCHIEIVKDSFNNAIEHEDPLERYKDIW